MIIIQCYLHFLFKYTALLINLYISCVSHTEICSKSKQDFEITRTFLHGVSV